MLLDTLFQIMPVLNLALLVALLVIVKVYAHLAQTDTFWLQECVLLAQQGVQNAHQPLLANLAQ